MTRMPLFVCVAVSALLSALSADAQLPAPKENVTNLVRPTISYMSYDSYEIRLMDWDGTNDRLWLGDGKVRFSGPIHWSPTGKRAAVITFDNADWSYTPYVINLKTERSQNLMEDPGIPKAKGAYGPITWSPDGRWLAMVDAWYVTNVIIHGYLYKVNVDNGTFVRLTKHAWMAPAMSAWSPDGKRIAFNALKEPKVEGIAAKRDIFVMNADGSNLTNITDHPAFEEFPSWSPDGKKIAFRGYRDNENLEVERPVGRVELYIMNPDGSNVERLTFNAGWEGTVSWSPDSKWIVYRAGPVNSDDSMLEGVYRMHIPTKKTVLIKQTRVREPKWVYAGKSRFLSVDPANKKKAQWGKIKAAGGNENSPAPQEVSPEE